MIASGTKFKVFGIGELENRGWVKDQWLHNWYHPDWSDVCIVLEMIKIFEGQILTVEGPTRHENWYYAVEDDFNYYWPVSIFLEGVPEDLHEHQEGMTPIDNWFICKDCGINLRKVK